MKFNQISKAKTVNIVVAILLAITNTPQTVLAVEPIGNGQSSNQAAVPATGQASAVALSIPNPNAQPSALSQASSLEIPSSNPNYLIERKQAASNPLIQVANYVVTDRRTGRIVASVISDQSAGYSSGQNGVRAGVDISKSGLLVVGTGKSRAGEPAPTSFGIEVYDLLNRGKLLFSIEPDQSQEEVAKNYSMTAKIKEISGTEVIAAEFTNKITGKQTTAYYDLKTGEQLVGRQPGSSVKSVISYSANLRQVTVAVQVSGVKVVYNAEVTLVSPSGQIVKQVGINNLTGDFFREVVIPGIVPPEYPQQSGLTVRIALSNAVTGERLYKEGRFVSIVANPPSSPTREQVVAEYVKRAGILGNLAQVQETDQGNTYTALVFSGRREITAKFDKVSGRLLSLVDYLYEAGPRGARVAVERIIKLPPTDQEWVERYNVNGQLMSSQYTALVQLKTGLLVKQVVEIVTEQGSSLLAAKGIARQITTTNYSLYGLQLYRQLVTVKRNGQTSVQTSGSSVYA